MERWKEWRGRGNIESKISEVNARAVSRGQNELIGELKKKAIDVIIFLVHFY